MEHIISYLVTVRQTWHRMLQKGFCQSHDSVPAQKEKRKTWISQEGHRKETRREGGRCGCTLRWRWWFVCWPSTLVVASREKPTGSPASFGVEERATPTHEPVVHRRVVDGVVTGCVRAVGDGKKECWHLAEANEGADCVVGVGDGGGLALGRSTRHDIRARNCHTRPPSCSRRPVRGPSRLGRACSRDRHHGCDCGCGCGCGCGSYGG